MAITLSRQAVRGRRDLLRRIPGLEDASERDLAELARLVEEVEVGAGSALVREGDDGLEAYLVVSGTAIVTVGGETIARLGRGDFVGELAMLDHGTRSATVTA